MKRLTGKPAMLRGMDLFDDVAAAEPALPVLSVSELNRMARRALESQLPLLWVEGEVSNFTRAASGHWYFAIKDASAQVRCVMFRGRNQFADFTPANGDHVEVRALPSLYEARGEFQLGVEQIRRAGAGRLYEAYLRLKAKLEAEGLFDPAKKRPLPRFPRRVGIVTSPQAAALHDVLTALARRMPGLPVVIYPTPVQGASAGAQIAAAIRAAGARAECDVLLVCRGGGSLEDLWAFNDEMVARAIAASPLPVVSGVGHETDFTLADFAADLRARRPPPPPNSPARCARICCAHSTATRNVCASISSVVCMPACSSSITWRGAWCTRPNSCAADRTLWRSTRGVWPARSACGWRGKPSGWKHSAGAW